MKIQQKIEKVFPPLQADRKRITRSSLEVVARELLNCQLFPEKVMTKARICTVLAKNNKKDYVFTLLVSKADIRCTYSVGSYKRLRVFWLIA